jgi:GTP-binding protein
VSLQSFCPDFRTAVPPIGLRFGPTHRSLRSMKVKYLKSGIQPADYPFPYKPEVAVVGRSNAGKSSFINALVGQKIAKVSQTPGKTRLLNFFELNEKVYMVDCPGYGFATGNRQEVLSWQNMIETYLSQRETLRGVMVIMDIRRDWDDEEQLLKEWLSHHKIPWILLLNKSDKLSRSQGLNRMGKIRAKAGDTPAFLVSSSKKTGFDDIKNLLFKEWS